MSNTPGRGCEIQTIRFKGEGQLREVITVRNERDNCAQTREEEEGDCEGEREEG